MKKIVLIALFWIGIISNSAMAQTISLNSGVSQNGVANKHQYQNYIIHASAGDIVRVELYRQDADGNLYVKIGQRAGRSRNDCKSENRGTSNETCSVTLTQDADVYISVYAYECVENVHHRIKATIDQNAVRLSSGVSRKGVVDKNRYQDYIIHASAGDTVKVDLSHQDANGNLYVKVGEAASIGRYDCHSTHSGSSNDTCSVTLTQDADVYISVYAYKCVENVHHTIKATIDHREFIRLSSGRKQRGVADKGQYQHYIIHASAGDTVKVDLFNQDADGDLYVKVGETASNGSYDCHSTGGGKSDESCSVTLDQDADVYIAVFAYRCVKTVRHTIKATIKKYPPIGTLEPRYSSNDGLSKPTENKPSIDNVFKTKIRRVTKPINAPDPDKEIVGYPKTQSWNKDMSLIRIKYRLYNATTLKESPITKSLDKDGAYKALCSPNDFRWSNKKANTFYAINPKKQFIRGKITNNTIHCNLVKSLENYDIVKLGPNEGNIDNNDQYVVLTLKKKRDSQVYIMLFDISKGEREWIKKLPGKIWKGGSPTFDWITVSQSGEYIVVNYAYIENDVYKYNRLTRYDINFEYGVDLKHYNSKGKLVSEGGHGDFGYDADGHEVFVANVSRVGVVSHDLDDPYDPATRLTNSPYGGGHISCRNTDRPGWCYITTVSKGNKRVFALKIDGTRETVQNFTQTHNKDIYNKKKKKYVPFHDNYGSPSPDGTKVIFNSHWDSEKIWTYVVEAK